MKGYNETIGNLVLTNFHADAAASMIESSGGDFAPTGTLTVRGEITSYVFNENNVPTIRGKLGLSSGGHYFNITAEGYGGLDIQAQIVGVGGFSKFGTAALLLKGTNNFTGAVGISEGTVDVYNRNAFGSTAGGVTLTGGSLTGI